MAYIAPDGTIKLLANIPLNSNYTDTLYFGSIQEQTSYFNGKAVKTFDNQSYTRAQNNTIRVEVTPDQIYNCNYLMFQNQGFGSAKWFYAFIVKTEYINNACCEITYEIDDMQTWFMQDYISNNSTLLNCLVEREHSETDNMYEHLQLENLDVGDYITSSVNISKLFNKLNIVAAVSANAKLTDDDSEQPCSVVDALIQGVKYYRFHQITDLNAFIKKLTDENLIDSLLSLFYVPVDLLKTNQTPGEYDTTPPLAKNVFGNTEQEQIVRPSSPSDLNYSGSIRNKKMYNYPYCFLGLQAGEQTVEFRYEYFKQENIQFNAYAPLQCNFEIGIVPFGYDNPNTSSIPNDFRNIIVMSGYPLASYSVDSYKAWLAQNKYNYLASWETAGITSVATGKAGNAVGTIIDSIASIVTAANQPPQTKGSFGGYTRMAIGNVVSGNVEYRALNVFAKCMRVNDEYLAEIDDYFSRYGYKSNVIKVPNINKRPKFNYTKTSGLTFKGNAPVDSNTNINNIFNRGITFWKDHDNVGNYSSSVLDGNMV